MSQALYRKYRSKSLDEIVGQEHITAILQRAIEQNKVAHAYLLTGPKGVGKTSIARIMAHAINNLPYDEATQHLDIIEIDAASNNSVEDVRDLRDKVQIAPISAKRKVYIIDEVHMLSKQAFNALLKTLEEPPAHIVFILATTDADKLPATIISRVQRFNFKAINEADAFKHLKAIAKKEKITIEDDALRLIATHGKGSFRDSIGLLDQMQHLSDTTITKDMIAGMLGLADQDTITDLLAAYSAADLRTIVTILNDATSRGAPVTVVTEQLIRTIRHSITEKPEFLPLLDDLLDVTRSAWPDIKLLTALTKRSAKQPSGKLESEKAGKQEHHKAAPTPRSAATQVAAPKAAQAIKSPATPIANEPTVATPTANEPRDKPETTIANNDNVTLVPFDWEAFIEAVKPKAAGAYIILKACGHSFDGTTLTIYAGKKFSKTKLEKAMPTLSAALDSVGMVAEISLTESPKPSEDATTAAILDMMGGGEELRATE